MPLTDQYQRLRLSSIGVLRDDRQRRDLKIDDHFLRSVRRNGIIEPIIVEGGGKSGQAYTLIAGERRYEASRLLGLEDIPVRLASELSEAELAILELEENVKRAELDWPDLSMAVSRVHALHCKLDPKWTMAETAETCSLSQGMVSMYITVSKELHDARVRDSGTVREAWNLVKRRSEREAADALQELLDGPEGEAESPRVIIVRDPDTGIILETIPLEQETEEEAREFTTFSESEGITQAPHTTYGVPPGQFDEIEPPPEVSIHPIQCASFLEWAPGYSGKKFNLLHCDFPYGVGLFSSNGIRTGEQRSQMGRDSGEAYDDRPEVYWELLQCLTDNLDSLMSMSGHIMFWLSADAEIVAKTLDHFRVNAPSLEFYRFPLIWVKTDNAGIASRPSHFPRHTYESCLFGTRGNRPLIRLVSDHYGAGVDKSIHLSCKPEPMLRHFMRMIVDEHTQLLDPTCGSGTSLRAAESLGARRVVGLERDPEMAEKAKLAFDQAKAKASLAESIL